jgi:glycosyltransferase involved in cell wall biosynthesis
VRLGICNHALRAGGGIERYALTLVRGLHEHGVRPALIAKAFDERLPEFGWVDALRVGGRWLPATLRDAWFDHRVTALKQRHALFPLIACNQASAADIAICGSTHPGFLEAMDQPRRRRDERWIALERAHLTNAQVVVAHSRLMAAQVRRFYGVAPGKIRLLYPPVDGAKFSPVDDAQRARLRQALQLPADRAVFLLASTGHLRKGLPMLAEFFRSTALPVTLVVAGRPIAEAGANIRALGYRADIENIYRAVDFTVMASRFEPFGLVGVESVLCGTPVLVARNVGCAEVLREPAALPFDLDGSADGLAAAVERAVARWRDGSHRIGAPARSLSYDPSVATHVTALLAIARDLVATRPASAGR